MESINFFKGYGKVKPTDDQSSRPDHKAASQKRRIAISLIILLTVIILSMVGVLVHKECIEDRESTGRSPESSASLSTTWTESIRTVCSVTQHPDSCFASIRSKINNSNPSKPDPEFILNLSLHVCVNELTNLSSLPHALILKSNDARTKSALEDCASLFGDALSQLNSTLSSMDVGPEDKVLTETKIGDMKTWISAAMTDQDTCLDGLEEMGSTVLDEVRAKVQMSKEYMSNSLAVLSNIQKLLSKFGLTMH